MLKAAIIFINYGPYHIARVKSAQKYLNLQGLSLIGIEIARNQAEYRWQTHAPLLPFKLLSVFSECVYEEIPTFQMMTKLVKTLSNINPDILVIAGYSESAMILALLWAKVTKKKTILLSESKQDDAQRSRLKEIFKQWLIKLFDAALVGGQPQKRYLETLGLESSGIKIGYDVVENEIFAPSAIRSLISPLETPFFLSINRFIPKKNLSFLLNAYASYRQKVGNLAWDLVLCGDGELRKKLEHEINLLSLNPYVRMTGFLQQNELLAYFSHARCFVHASLQEQWGLVVNEAMSAGIPPLVSRNCGCFEDLIIEGVTGFGFDPQNLEELSQQMMNISQGNYDLPRIGEAALAHVNQHFSTDQFGVGLADAIDYALKSKSI